VACLPYLLAAAEDRSAEVRKNAQEALLPFMIHVGYEPMIRASSKLSVSDSIKYQKSYCTSFQIKNFHFPLKFCFHIFALNFVMIEMLTLLQAASRTALAIMLEKARGNLPAKPVKAAEPKAAAARPGKPAAAAPSKVNTNTITKSKVGYRNPFWAFCILIKKREFQVGIAKPAASRARKEEDVDLSPLLQENNLKVQRMSDEQKLKVWLTFGI
jgi:hypothetical protein